MQICDLAILKWWAIKDFLTWLSVYPGQEADTAVTVWAVCVRLTTVENLLAVCLTRQLCFHSYLQHWHLFLLKFPRSAPHLCALSVHPHHTLFHCRSTCQHNLFTVTENMKCHITNDHHRHQLINEQADKVFMLGSSWTFHTSSDKFIYILFTNSHHSFINITLIAFFCYALLLLLLSCTVFS